MTDKFIYRSLTIRENVMRLPSAKGKNLKIVLILVVLLVVFFAYNIYGTENLDVEAAWSRNTTRNVSVYISPNEETAIQLPDRFCNSEVFLLVIIYSAPENFAARKVIRETWASRKEVLNYFVDFYFLLGSSNDLAMQGLLEDEGLRYDDIVQEDFAEGYYNLSIKSMFMLKNVDRHCIGKAEYLLKIDDDMYLGVENLINTLITLDGNNVIMGHVFDHVRPIRNTRSKWYAPYYLYEDNYYPPFVSGTCYLLSVNVAQKLYNASFNRPIYHLEDVFVTGMLSEDIGVKPQDNSLFSYKKIFFAPCTYLKLITSHGYTDTQLSWLYRRIQKSDLKELCALRCRHSFISKCMA